MPLVTIVIVLVIVGVVLWGINTYIPMAKPMKTILNVVVIGIVCVWMLQTFGVIDSIRGIRVR